MQYRSGSYEAFWKGGSKSKKIKIQNKEKEGQNGSGGGGGGGTHPQIFVGMCRGKVNNWPGFRNERENAGLRNELEPF